MSQGRGVILIVVSAAAFGLMPLFRDWAARGGVSTEMLLTLRFAIASAVLMIAARARGDQWPRGGTLAVLALMGAGCYFGESLCYFRAIEIGTPSGLVSLLLYTYPAMVALGAWAILRERPTGRALGAMGLALIGAAMTIGPINPGGAGASGIMLSLGAAAIYATYILIGSRLPGALPAIPAAAVVTAFAAGSFGVMAATRGPMLPMDVAAWTGVLALALVSTVVGITAFLAGVARVGPVRASTLSVIEPATTVLIGAALLGERLTALKVAGGALILIAAVIAARARRAGPVASATGQAQA